MKQRRLGVLLILTLIVAGVSLGQDLRFDNSLGAARADAAGRDARLAAIDRDLADLRAAHAGYVATGQDPAYWMGEAATLAGRLETELSALSAAAPDDETRQHYERALAAVAGFNTIDERTRKFVSDNQLFLASDLIFMDSAEATQKAAAALAEARGAEHRAAEASLYTTRWLRFSMDGLAMGFLVVVAFLAVRGARDEADTAGDGAEVGAPATGAPAAPPARDLDLGGGAAVIVREVGVSRAGLDDAAELCGDLARLSDSRDLPAIVERAARVLDARGLVLWAVDTSGSLLQPALTHGYSDRVIKRLGSLQIDGDNVTALAFRSMKPQTMKGAGEDAPGAVAVPLVTTTGCVGVLAVETRSRRPKSETCALARIVASQFSTVIQPVTSPASPALKSRAD
ncbi:MAG TPA: GAF domain-containing protein [Vicinamibacterales bacterium]|nr:GAF domain-containing protein [Vicinamibacterales bacterium]